MLQAPPRDGRQGVEGARAACSATTSARRLSGRGAGSGGGASKAAPSRARRRPEPDEESNMANGAPDTCEPADLVCELSTRAARRCARPLARAYCRPTAGWPSVGASAVGLGAGARGERWRTSRRGWRGCDGELRLARIAAGGPGVASLLPGEYEARAGRRRSVVAVLGLAAAPAAASRVEVVRCDAAAVPDVQPPRAGADRRGIIARGVAGEDSGAGWDADGST